MRYSTLRLLFIFLGGMSVSFNGQCAQPYQDQNRIAYIGKTLRAFGETKLQRVLNTYSYINAVDANNCRSAIADLRVDCLLEFANKNCATLKKKQLKQQCELYSDIIIVNRLSENTFLDRTERYRLSKNSGYDFRKALQIRLIQKYARIVTQFSLSPLAECADNDYDCLAKGLDKFCLDYTNAHSLSWQYCIGASLWFIGTSKAK